MYVFTLGCFSYYKLLQVTDGICRLKTIILV
nr:MAG TPA: hypothetical protein [Bacteriophage sp.]